MNTDRPVASQLCPRSDYHKLHKTLRYTHLVLLDSSGYPSKVCPCWCSLAGGQARWVNFKFFSWLLLFIRMPPIPLPIPGAHPHPNPNPPYHASLTLIPNIQNSNPVQQHRGKILFFRHRDGHDISWCPL